MIDFGLMEANQQQQRELSPSEIENMLPAGPKTNRYTGVIERIERMYGGEYSKGRKQDDYDFEDSFIDDSDWVRHCCSSSAILPTVVWV
jgi:hypothetical protein